MKGYLFDQKQAINDLKSFFTQEKAGLNSFGNKVNQTFEAYTFAETIKWYKNNGWRVTIKNPLINKVEVFKLKFNTRGAPKNYSFVLCEKDDERCQIRHQLRVSTKNHSNKNKYSANICCDITIINNEDLDFFLSDSAISNKKLISFAEVKHMSAYAELIASFIGMVHELQPKRLKRIRIKKQIPDNHIPPYLNLSGTLRGTARGVVDTIEKRKYDIDIYHYERKIN